MEQIIAIWSQLPGVFAQTIADPGIWLWLIIGVVAGYIIGVIPGLGVTMGLALSLGIVFTIPSEQGLALLIGILVAGCGSGGITASLANIPGTAAAAATCMDGYPMALNGRAREAVGYSYMASVIGTVLAMVFVFAIQPLVTVVALKFGDWEVFLFCTFGLILCGSLVGGDPLRGWVSAMVGLFLSYCGAESVQSVVRYSLGIPQLITGFETTVAVIGLFGLAEAVHVLRSKEKLHVTGESQKGFPIVKIKVFIEKWKLVLKSMFAGVWVGFIPGIGETAACWFAYDIAKRGSKEKHLYGKGSEEGVIAAEVGNNASTVGALIPSLALGIPGSATTAIFIAAMFLMGYRPGPTLLKEHPDILPTIAIQFILAAGLLAIIAYFLSRFVISFLSIPITLLMPLIIVFCVVGTYGTTYTTFSLFLALFFTVLGVLMKMFSYPIPPLILGLLIGGVADASLRRALMQYSMEPLALFTRPFGTAVLLVLLALMVFSIYTTKKTKKISNEAFIPGEDEINNKNEEMK